MVSHPRSVVLTTLAAALLGSTGCTDVGAIDESWEERQGFAHSGTRLAIDSDGTDLRLVAGTGDTVDVERTLTGKATVDGNAAWSLEAGTLRLRATCSGFVPNCGARHVVHVPAGVTAVDVTSGGPVRVVGLSADLTAKVTGGWLRVEAPSGTLRLRAEQNVDVTAARSTDVTATSADRAVNVAFAGAPTRVRATASEGPVTVTLPGGRETYRITTTPGKREPRSDPASRRVVTATAGDGHTATVRTAD